MSMRGRGTLEVKPCDNPFFQTTNANIGAVAGQRQWVAPESYKPKKLQKDTRYDFNFMYRKVAAVASSRCAPSKLPRGTVLTPLTLLS